LPKVDLSASSLRSRRQVLVALGAVGASACGYSLSGRGSFLPDYIRRVGIPLFENRTPFVTIEQLFTERVRVEFQSRGRYAVQPTADGADGVVRGDITGISVVPAAFGNQQLATRYRFTVTVGVRFEDATQNKVLWENPALSFTDEYELQNRLTTSGSANPAEGAAFLEQERAAIERLATDFARSVVSSILEAF
jgi:hypothetical protein